VAALLPLSPGQRQLLGLLGLLGPMSGDELAVVAQRHRAGAVADLVADLLARGLLTPRAGRLTVTSGLVAASAAATIRTALAARCRARLAAIRAVPGGDASGSNVAAQRAEGAQTAVGAVPTPEAFLAALGRAGGRGGDPDGEHVIETARWAQVVPGADAGRWAALAAVVLLGRARVDRVDGWLARAAAAGCDGDLLHYVRAGRARLLAGEGPAPGPVPALLSGAGGVFATHARIGRELASAGARLDDGPLREVLQAARTSRAVASWSRAAQLARRRGVPVGPALLDAQGRSDVQGALLSMLVAGCSTGECSRALGLGVRAVEKRITALYREAGCAARTALVGAYVSGALGDPAA
jgi:DNA-binding CsgD family transcriptional regulator/phosphatidylglycerophosphate synthase